MAYDRRKLFADIDALLTMTPRKTLREISQERGVGRHTIERFVHDTTGKSFRVLQQKRTLLRFLELLKQHPEFSEKQIAAEVGYRSSEAFSRFIKSMTGRSPSEIRQSPRIQQLLWKKFGRQ